MAAAHWSPILSLWFNSNYIEETLCMQAGNATALKTLTTLTPNTTHTNPQSSWGDIMRRKQIEAIQLNSLNIRYTRIAIALVGYLDLSKSKGFYNKRGDQCCWASRQGVLQYTTCCHTPTKPSISLARHTQVTTKNSNTP